MADTDVWSRWRQCGTWSGTVFEQRVENPMHLHPERECLWDEDCEAWDSRSIATVLDGVDWFKALWQAYQPYALKPVEMLVEMTVDGSIRVPVSGRLHSLAMTGRSGLLLVGDSVVTEQMEHLLGRHVDLTVSGRVQVSIERHTVVRLAHPWKGHAPGAWVSVNRRDADGLRRSGYLAGIEA